MRLIGYFRQDQKVVTTECLCRLPLLTMLVEPGEGDGVAGAARVSSGQMAPLTDAITDLRVATLDLYFHAEDVLVFFSQSQPCLICVLIIICSYYLYCRGIVFVKSCWGLGIVFVKSCWF